MKLINDNIKLIVVIILIISIVCMPVVSNAANLRSILSNTWTKIKNVFNTIFKPTTKDTFTIVFDANTKKYTGTMKDQEIKFDKPNQYLNPNKFKSTENFVFAGWYAVRKDENKELVYNKDKEREWLKVTNTNISREKGFIGRFIYNDKDPVSRTAEVGKEVTMKAIWVKLNKNEVTINNGKSVNINVKNLGDQIVTGDINIHSSSKNNNYVNITINKSNGKITITGKKATNGTTIKFQLGDAILSCNIVVKKPIAQNIVDAASKVYNNGNTRYNYNSNKINFKNMEEIRQTCCATFVAYSICKAGIVSFDDMIKERYNSSSGLYEALINKYGFSDVGRITNLNNLKPGDIVYYINKHIEIYAGKINNVHCWYNGGATNGSSAIQYRRNNYFEPSNISSNYTVIRYNG